MTQSVQRSQPETLIQRIRVRALAILVAAALATIATISLTTLPAWPIVGVAVATVAVAVNKLTSRLKAPVCWGCGHDLARIPSGEYGVICPECGTMSPGAVPGDGTQGPTRSA